MEWLVDNWLIVALLGGMAGIHLFGHRRGGGHGCCGGGEHGHGKNEGGKEQPTAEDETSR